MGMQHVMEIAPRMEIELRRLVARVESATEFGQLKDELYNLAEMQISMWESIQKK